MKKFVVLLVVVAMTCFSAMAFAADVTVGGSFEVRSRDFNNLNVVPDAYGNSTTGDKSYRDTQNRIRIDVNAKAGDVKGKIQLESDFQNGSAATRDWGSFGSGGSSTVDGYYNTQTGGQGLGFREAWVNFNLPFAPINVTAGHQLLSLGNGYFFRAMHYGADAWVVANQTGNNTVAFVNAKVAEFSINNADDVDAYVLLDVFKLSDALTVGADLTKILDRKGNALPGYRDDLYNLGLNLNAKFGILGLKIEGDMQAGRAQGADLITVPVPSGNAKFKGNQVVIQGNVGLDPVTVNFTLARGTGAKSGQSDVNQFVNFLDIDPHYTFLYEYKLKTAAGATSTGFTNTTAASVGVSAAATKSLTIGADLWLLRATQAVALNGATVGGLPATSRKLGTEVDVKANWKISDNLSWNWTLGLLKPGEAYDSMVNGAAASADDVMGIQGILAFKF